MTFVLTLLTFFVDGKPDVPPPTTEMAEMTCVSESFSLPQLTPPAWHGSPSWMVAHPPRLTNLLDELSSAEPSPQDVPGLFPADSVTLVPCPAPGSLEEVPAVRHVGFARGGAAFHLASKDSPCETACPLGKSEPDCNRTGKSLYERPHARHPGLSHPFSPFHHPPFPPPHPGHPVAFGPMGGPYEDFCPVGMPCPTGMACPALSEVGLFPGAKKVQHVVRATYDVPHQTAKAMKSILEQSEGVLSCVVEGDELTINAVAPSQSAIAQFLATVVNQPRIISHPAKAIDVKISKPNCCNSECDCKCECKCKCECCGKEDKTTTSTEVDAWKKKFIISSKAKAIEKALGIDFKISSSKASRCSAGECSKASKCSATAKCSTATQCNTPCETQAVVQWKTSQSKPVRVEIQATPEGVVLRTSDGTVLRATQIQLETNNLGRLEVRQSGTGFTMPKPQVPQYEDPAANKPGPKTTGFRFGGVQFTR